MTWQKKTFRRSQFTMWIRSLWHFWLTSPTPGNSRCARTMFRWTWHSPYYEENDKKRVFSFLSNLFWKADEVITTQVLLPASSILQMSSVREACCKFLMRQLHPTNCLGIRNFADTHACKELHKRSHKFALENFQEVMSTEEFLLLPFQEVRMWMLK